MATFSQDLYDIDTNTINYIDVLDSTYLDPDQEYASLDNESSCSFTDHSLEIPGTPNTDSSGNEKSHSDTFSNKVAYKLALNYFRRLSNNDEIYNDIDWLSSDLDKSTDTESSLDGKLKRCSNETSRPIRQMMGIWELDYETVEKMLKTDSENILKLLGVCSNHFNFDQDGLHPRGSKALVSIQKSWIHKWRCLFCHKDKFFFSRGGKCTYHSWNVLNKNVQIPCQDIKVCPVFSWSHFFQRKSRGANPFSCKDLHLDDSSKALEFFGNWILNIATSSDKVLKDILVDELFEAFNNFFLKKKLIKNESRSISTSPSNIQVPKFNPPSYMAIKIAMRLKKIQLSSLFEMGSHLKIVKEQSKQLGKALGCAIWKARSEIRENKEKLKNPQSLDLYHNGFSDFLKNFIDEATHNNRFHGFEVGITSFVKNQLLEFEKIFNTLQETKKENFDFTDILKEIKKKNEDELFQGTTQNTVSGFQKIFECYEIGKNRLATLYKQDIEKSEECNTSGRRMQNIVVNRSEKKTKHAEKKHLRKKQKYDNIQSNNMQNCTYEQECYLQ
ncbi:14958_t:CDS:2 [Cetraspora pellucida]|uniref:14958_t:CDS:1 n=1 Tax=Cetraspora pellucida TaxID=1433469 RepID=A0ACA9JYA2_9GLOM|nr:14958_t:CDS:2 [Cetraspora pellucida]